VGLVLLLRQSGRESCFLDTADEQSAHAAKAVRMCNLCDMNPLVNPGPSHWEA